MAETKEKAKKAQGPSTLSLVVEAIKSVDDRKGASIQMIKTHILQKYPDRSPEMLKALLKRAIQKGLDDGTLIRPAKDTSSTGLTGRLKVNKEKKEEKPKKKKEASKSKEKTTTKAKATKAPKMPKTPLKKRTSSPKKAAKKPTKSPVKKTKTAAKPKTPKAKTTKSTPKGKATKTKK